MPYQNISADLNDADLKAVKDDLADIRAKLPFLILMTPGERKAAVKMGQRSVAFVNDALAAAEAHPNMQPGTFDLVEFRRDVQLANRLGTVLSLAEELVSALDDTTKAVGSEAMLKALMVYRLAKEAARTEAGMKPVAAQLSVRFEGMGRVKRTAPDSTPSSDPSA